MRAELDPLAAGNEPAAAAAAGNVNMHMHSFFSYNADGWSPSHLAWEARKAGLYGAGLCDFDVLDGLEEFLDAGAAVGLRATVNLETRAYLAEYADADINSPGEAGVAYIMGTGHPRVPGADSEAGRRLQQFRAGARSRNESLMARLNAALPQLPVDYEKDVLPLTPAGNATERHIITAYVNRAIAQFEHPQQVMAFWSEVLGRDPDAMLELMADRPRLEEVVRARLVKRGGLAYEPPSVDAFPPVDDFIAWVLSCDAIPTIGWLDGTSDGESDSRGMFECLKARGAAALNIVPDRNWNIADPATRDLKVGKLREAVETAEAMHLPINIGTEMNKSGLPFVDDLAGEVLAEFRESFLRGTRIMVGQSILARYAGVPYCSSAAAAAFKDTPAKNACFAAVGALPPLTRATVADLAAMGPERAWTHLQDAATAFTNSVQ